MRKKIEALMTGIFLMSTMFFVVGSLQRTMTQTTYPEIPQKNMMAHWTQTFKITAEDGTLNDYFGWAVSLYDDTALIGVYNDDEAGALAGSAYVYHRTGTTWTQQAKLLASDAEAGDRFGYSVSIFKDIALIGAATEGSKGAVYVFTRTGTTWSEQQKLVAYDGAANDQYGCAVSLYEQTALIGADMDDDLGTSSGSAYVYTWNGTTWVHIQKLHSAAGETFFGCSVAQTKDTALVGANSEESKGYTYVFIHPGVDWILQEKFTGSDSQDGDCFGNCVSLDGDTALIGAPWDDDVGDSSGTAFIFTRNGTDWHQTQKLHASDGTTYDIFGRALAMSGDTALIASYGDDDQGSASGSVYVFINNGTSWTETQKLLASDGAAADEFGVAVALDGNTALIGADKDNNIYNKSGSVYVFSSPSGNPHLNFNIISGLGVNLKIQNNGTGNATNVEWHLLVSGGFLGRIKMTVNGTLDIQMGTSRTVGTGVFFGLGPITITADVAGERKTADGTHVFIFSLINQ